MTVRKLKFYNQLPINMNGAQNTGCLKRESAAAQISVEPRQHEFPVQ